MRLHRRLRRSAASLYLPIAKPAVSCPKRFIRHLVWSRSRQFPSVLRSIAHYCLHSCRRSASSSPIFQCTFRAREKYNRIGPEGHIMSRDRQSKGAKSYNVVN